MIFIHYLVDHLRIERLNVNLSLTRGRQEADVKIIRLKYIILMVAAVFQ